MTASLPAFHQQLDDGVGTTAHSGSLRTGIYDFVSTVTDLGRFFVALLNRRTGNELVRSSIGSHNGIDAHTGRQKRDE